MTFLMSVPVVHCHNRECTIYGVPYLQHQERETGAWVPALPRGSAQGRAALPKPPEGDA